MATVKIFKVYTLKETFNAVLNVLDKVLDERHAAHKNKVRPGPKTKFSDLHVIALSITAAIEGFESEYYFFSKLPKADFPDLLSRRQYNDRKRRLANVIDEVRESITKEINQELNEIIVDSTPVKISKYARWSRIKVCKENQECQPNVGYCASQQEHFFGFRLHAVTSKNGVVQYYRLTKASEGERTIFPFIAERFSNCTLLGDMGYLGEQHEKSLFEQSKIVLQTPFRKNQKNKPPEIKGNKRKRRIIETVFSNLKEQFKISINHAKNFTGFLSRLTSKLCGLVLCQYLNKINRGVVDNKVKYAL